MPVSQQKLNKIEVATLKNLKDVEIDFTDSALTAIMGTNGSGKSTVLHALACAYAPPNGADGYRFPLFFKPNTDGLWAGSDFTIHYNERDGRNYHAGLSKRYRKEIDRWSPRYDNRPARPVRLVTIQESVPEVETLNINGMVHYHRQARDGEMNNSVRVAAGQILNRNYAGYHSVQYQRGGRPSIAVTNGGLSYAALSMSAGEQRVFRILDAVFGADEYSLILIDEMDLFLHQDALKKLLELLNEHCTRNHKQLIFTTHFPPIADMYETISVRTLHRTPAQTLVYKGYSYDALRLLTGNIQRPIRVYVEDYVAEGIVREVARSLGLQSLVHVGWYGPCSNAFPLGAGLVLTNEPLDHVLIVLDGDVSSTAHQRRTQIKKHLTGTEPRREAQRADLFRVIRPLLSPSKTSPEQMLHGMLAGITPAQVPAADVRMLQLAHEVVNVPERHGYIDEVVRASGEDRVYAVRTLIALATLSPEWGRYTKLIRIWLERQAALLNI
ncbi:AAA family ATPase [Pandoraea pneumonica]